MPKRKATQWFKPSFEFEENKSPKKVKVPNGNANMESSKTNSLNKHFLSNTNNPKPTFNVSDSNWMRNFDPECVEDLAVHNKKILEIEDWLKVAFIANKSEILLLTGPVGCGKTATIHSLAKKHNIKLTEWITPLDIEVPSENGEYEFKQKQSTKFLEFIINAANFVSLLDNNSKKLVVVEDFPNTFLRTPSEFTDVLHQYKSRAKSPIVFICSECHTDGKNTAANLFTPQIVEQFQIHQTVFNSVSATGLRSALKRISEIIKKKFTTIYNVPTPDMIECVLNSSGGDVRSAALNLHFACLKGGNCNLETSVIVEREIKSKTTKKKKQTSNKFLSLGKDQTVSILHGVGRVLNPKVITENGNQKLSHAPCDVMEQFLSHPNSFINFLAENYIPHFSNMDYVDKAASALSDADYMLAEWREKLCQEYGLYTAVAGLMLANKTPVSAWNPVRGPKNMRIQYPLTVELPLLEQDYLYKGKVLVTDYQTYHKIIGNKF